MLSTLSVASEVDLPASVSCLIPPVKASGSSDWERLSNSRAHHQSEILAREESAQVTRY